MRADPCRLPRSHLSEYLDGQPLPLGTRLVVRMHLTICPPCRRLRRSLVATQAALHALRDADADAEVGTDE